MLVKRKIFFAWNQEKEKAFLEKMSSKGYKLAKIGLFKYTFTEFEPEELNYQFEFRTYDKMTEEEFLKKYTSEGWEYISKYGPWYYFSHKDPDGVRISIFNDSHIRLQRYKRILIFLCITGFPLYFNVLLYPSLIDPLNDLTVFTIFRLVLLPFLILHAYAVFRIFKKYRGIKVKLKEL